MFTYNDYEKLPELVNEYIGQLLVVNDKSPATVNQYLTDIILFLRYVVAKKSEMKSPDDLDENYDLSFINTDFFANITLKDVNSFLIYCSTERQNSARTRARKASSIRSFFSYISDKMKYIPSNPVSQLQVASTKKSLPKYLTLEQSQQLLSAVNGENKERDYCIITLFLNCGLRLAELCSLNLYDINFSEQTMKVTGKGNKERMLYLNKACIMAIQAYLPKRHAGSLKGKDRDALFVSRLNKRIGRQTVQLMVNHYLAKIGLDGQHYSVHKLRHTAATLMYQHGDVDVLVLKDMLGHESLATTQIYTHVENKQLREAIKNNPLSMEFKEEKS